MVPILCKRALELLPTFTSLTKRVKSCESQIVLLQSDVTSRISEMPPEIVRIVLQHVLNTSQADFTLALCVSRTWNNLGTPLLWKDLVLRPENLHRCNQAIESRPGAALFTQSLTITIQDKQPVVVHNDFQNQVLELMNSLPNITTFSLYSGNEDGDSDHVSTDLKWFLDFKWLDELLRALPKSITCLEIDLAHVHVRVPGGEYHVCDTIRQMLPHLQHLRLFRGKWCHHLILGLNQECKNLTSVTVNDNRRYYKIFLQRMRSDGWRHYLAGELIATEARKAVEAGYMPALQSFNVIVPNERNPPLRTSSEQRSIDLDSKNERERTFSCFQLKDVVKNQTTSFPFGVLDCRRPYYYMLRCHADINTDSVIECFGSYEEVSSFLEPRTYGWVQTKQGARLPPSFKASPQGQAGLYQWKEHHVLSQRPLRSAEGRESPDTKLWYWERLSGRRLLRPIVHEGLGRGPAVTRECCEDEKNADLVAQAPGPQWFGGGCW